jgi:hypothetical protein
VAVHLQLIPAIRAQMIESCFFLFDSVHLLKCVRNNWLGQRDVENTFVFPDMVDDKIHKASFSHLRKLYLSEKDNYVKLAPGLSYKSLYPTNTERQNVKLALKVFDEKTVAALNQYGTNTGLDVSGTSTFIGIISRLWKIMNVKSTDKGRHKRDSDLDPIRSVNDEHVVFLRDVHNWIMKWERLNQKAREGRLTNETMFALKHTVGAFVELVTYLFVERNVFYVLIGKFQTDCLEFRFSQYRRLSGTNYNVSVQELKESEKKLKIVSMLHVVSASRGSITMKDFITPVATNTFCNEIDIVDSVACLLPALADCDNVEISESECQSLVFIAGYVGHKLLRNKISCDLCQNELVCERSLQYDLGTDEYSYLFDIDRGGLKWPTDLLLEIVTQAFLVFRTVISKDYESKFLSVGNQKAALKQLIVERLQNCGAVVGECTCGTTILKLAEQSLSTITNILLNNYCKHAADKTIADKQSNKAKRKLSTLHK